MIRFTVELNKHYNPISVPWFDCDICATSLLDDNKPRYGVYGWEDNKHVSYNEVCSEECANMYILSNV